MMTIDASRRVIHHDSTVMYLDRPWPVKDLAKMLGFERLNCTYISDEVIMFSGDAPVRPINHAATALYNAGRAGIETTIRGSIAIVPSDDFEAPE